MSIHQSTKGNQSGIVNIDTQMKVYLGGGCNSIILLSNDGRKAIIVDTKYFSGAKKLRTQISSPEITVINTHFHLDHARGNRLYPEAFVISGNTNWKQWDFDTAHSKHPDKILNPGEDFIMNIDDEIVHVFDMGRAHSPNDLIVYFEKRKVLAAGDLIWTNMHPVLLHKNVNIKLWISYLDKMEKSYDVQTVVPGHGSISSKESISDMKEYFTSILHSINSNTELKKLKQQYSNYSTFPFFGNFSRTLKIIKKEIRNNPDSIS
jgi:cyclase